MLNQKWALTSLPTEMLDQFQWEDDLRGFAQQTAQATASHIDEIRDIAAPHIDQISKFAVTKGQVADLTSPHIDQVNGRHAQINFHREQSRKF